MPQRIERSLEDKARKSLWSAKGIRGRHGMGLQADGQQGHKLETLGDVALPVPVQVMKLDGKLHREVSSVFRQRVSQSQMDL